jgi:hypothetical protein
VKVIGLAQRPPDREIKAVFDELGLTTNTTFGDTRLAAKSYCGEPRCRIC